MSLSHITVALLVSSAHAWPCGWSCHGHGDWTWWKASCSCNADREGSCCETPKTCTTAMSDLCPQSKMMEKTAKCELVGKDGPMRIAGKNFPEALRGVFWLAEQGDSSALMSFAESNDGAGLSQGKLDPEPSDGYHYKIRVGGDRVWSFHDKASSWGLVEVLDLVYKFVFDDPAKPTVGQIIPSGENLNGFDLTATWLLNFKMTLLPKGTHQKYKNSTVWGRPSAVLGIEGGYYDLIQVMDETGYKLEPAYSDWVEYCQDGTQTGKTPGEIHYREAV